MGRVSAGERPRDPDWISDSEFRLGNQLFECRPVLEFFESTTSRLCLRKPRWMVEDYVELLGRTMPRRILEVGLADGASTAMLAHLTDPELLVAADISEERAEVLDHLIDREGWQDSVRPHFGIDQADDELPAIAEREFGTEPLDLIIDDASHELDRTRRTFEMLFPLLAEGGRYLIEDWAWAHAFLPMRTDQLELTRLVFELTVACGARPDLIASVDISRGWVVVGRGPARPDRDFRLAEHLGERGARLLARLGSEPAS